MPAKICKTLYFRNLFAIALITGGYGLYLLPQLFNIGGVKGFCIFHALTGIPCPGCGMGKASVLFLRGSLYESLIEHPLAIPFTVATLAALFWLSSDLFRNKETLLHLLKQRLKWPYSLLLFVVVMAAWIYNMLK